MGPRRIAKIAARAWYCPPRHLNTWMSLVALSGLLIAQLAPGNGAPGVVPPRVVPLPPYLINTSPRLVPPPVELDRFVVAAPEGIDPRFVVAAPVGIDDGMAAPDEGRFATSGR